MPKPQTTLCSFCKNPRPVTSSQCLNCGGWSGLGDGGIGIHSVYSDASVLLSEVKSSELNRVVTGPWDDAFGTNWETDESGIVRGSTVLIGGEPGAGKSTFLLQISSSTLSRLEGETLYIAAEEQLSQIKSRADRLELENANRIRMVAAMSGDANVGEILRRRKPVLTVLDSVSSISNNDLDLEVQIAKIFKRECETIGCPGILVSQINKGGDFAGLQKLQHEVDTTMQFYTLDEGDVRVLQVIKNRNGRAGIEKRFIMTEKGLVLIEDEPSNEENTHDSVQT